MVSHCGYSISVGLTPKKSSLSGRKRVGDGVLGWIIGE